MRIGIMGGTFDPIHYGHLISAEEIADIFKMNLVMFMPAFIPPHKKKGKMTDVHHRLIMTTLATVPNPGFAVSAFEIERGGCSYTIDTVRGLKKKFKEKIRLYFIAGIDAFQEIATWKDAGSLFKNCDFIVSTRPGYRIDDLFYMLDRTVSKKYRDIKFRIEKKNPFYKSSSHPAPLPAGERIEVRGHGSKYFIYPVETTALDISSTEIRRRVRQGMTIKYLLPEPVEEYIYKNGLYRES
ncbi:MAG: nicotinate-nucleotide adenylyltransferase [Nitrospinae bacterium]|nr:nicotinate-nucleotide adenylyltransferase [Nitrospinota bacterium]